MKPQAIGNITVTNVVDSVEHWSPRYLFADLSYDDFKPHVDWLRPHFLDENLKMLLSIHSFVVKTRHHTILVDTCLGADKKRNVPQWSMRKSPFLRDLAAAGCPPESVDYVFCTHMHIDHVGWNTKLENGRWVPSFPNAKYLFNKTEWEFWKAHGDEAQQEINNDSVLPIIEANKVQWVDSDFAIDDDLHLEPSPGHTPGHCCVYLHSGDQRAVITGDMIHHPIQIGEPHRRSTADADPELAEKTRREFVHRHADTGMKILGTHFHDPTAMRIVSKGENLRIKL
ncbi:MAG: MBL fold metallo-hydrolase [Candidatus Lambdaproteobacteria bacterium]|nr:MBL fold metallo-hydrolase [Candidatus Lambdaproteobacteria bacterium]